MNYQFHNYISLLIKPTDDCNIRCVYCFHRNTIGYSKGVMPIETLEKIYQITFPHFKNVRIVWHGGEPTCAGIDFYKKAFELQKKYAEQYHVAVHNSMQTNGTQITQEFIDLIKENKIALGVSYDGVVNDITRKDTEAVNSNRLMLNNNSLDPGIITVITGLNVDRLIENYEAMKGEKRNYQMNHYVETDRDHPNNILSLDFDHYALRIKELFDYWINDSECNIDVQPFDQLFLECLLGAPTVCTRASCHRSWMCIEPNGKITPCDKKFPDEYTYGNVLDMDDIREVYNSEGFNRLLKEVVERRNKCIDQCEYYGYCEGGCSHSAMAETGLNEIGGFSCKSQQLLIGTVLDYIKENGITVENYESKFVNPVLIKCIRSGIKCRGM